MSPNLPSCLHRQANLWEKFVCLQPVFLPLMPLLCLQAFLIPRSAQVKFSEQDFMIKTHLLSFPWSLFKFPVVCKKTHCQVLVHNKISADFHGVKKPTNNLYGILQMLLCDVVWHCFFYKFKYDNSIPSSYLFFFFLKKTKQHKTKPTNKTNKQTRSSYILDNSCKCNLSCKEGWKGKHMLCANVVILFLQMKRQSVQYN